MHTLRYPLLVMVLSFLYRTMDAQQPDRPVPPKPLFLEKMAHQGAIVSVALSPDEKTIATLGTDQLVKLWTISGKPLGQQSVKVHEVASKLAFSPDGKEVAVGESDGQLSFVDSASCQLKRRVRCHDKVIQSVAYSRSGKKLATGSFDGTVRLWDTTTYKEVNRIDLPGWGLAFSTDERLAIPSNEGIQLWNLTTMKSERSFLRQGFYHSDPFFALGGKLLIGELSVGICLWDVDTGNFKETIFGYFTTQAPMAVSSDGQTFLTSQSHDLKVWNLTTGQEIQELTDFDYTLTDGHIALGGQVIIIGNRDGVLGYYAREVQPQYTYFPSLSQESVSIKGQALERLFLKEPKLLMKEHWRMGKVAFSADGKKLYASGQHGELPVSALQNYQNGSGFVRCWDLAAKKEIAVFPPVGTMRFGHYRGTLIDSVSAFAVSPDDKLLAIASRGSIVLWDTSTKRQVCVIDSMGKDHIKGLYFPLFEGSMTFSSDSKLLAISTVQGTWIWDVVARKVISQAKEGGHVSFFAKNKYFATAMYHNRLKLWETATGKEVAEDHPEMGILHEGSVSADNRWLVAGGVSGAMIWKLFDTDTKPRLARSRRLTKGLDTTGLSMSRDGSRILTTGRTPQLWNTETGKEIARLDGARGSQHGALSPDGKLAAILGLDGIYIWGLDSLDKK